MNIHDREIHICTDSQAALKAQILLLHVGANHRMFTYHKQTESNEEQITWGLGHHWIESSEKAYELARQYNQQPFQGPEPIFGLPYLTENWN